MLMPTSRPSVSTSAPPLLPGLIGRVGLDVDHRVFGRQLPRHGADDAHRDRRLQPQRAAERQHELPGAQRIGIAERQRRQAARVDLHDRDVGLVIDRHDLRADGPSAPLQDRSPGARRSRSSGSSTSIRVAFSTTCALVTM